MCADIAKRDVDSDYKICPFPRAPVSFWQTDSHDTTLIWGAAVAMIWPTLPAGWSACHGSLQVAGAFIAQRRLRFKALRSDINGRQDCRDVMCDDDAILADVGSGARMAIFLGGRCDCCRFSLGGTTISATEKRKSHGDV